MITYKHCPPSPMNQQETSVFKLVDDVVVMCIPFDPANTDYQAYLKWVEEGGVPLPADEPQA